MMYTSNINTVIDNLSVKLIGIQNVDFLLQEIAVSLAASNTRRIHNESEDVKGSEITLKASRKTPKRGAYSRSWAGIRDKKGRQISKVDFSFTGKLSKEFQAAPITGGWGVGFTTSGSGKISEFLEDKFGNVWGVTEQDGEAISRIVSKVIKNKLK